MGVLATALLAGRAGIALLDTVLFVINSGEVVFRSAGQAMIPSVVPRARLERANGWLVGGTTLAQGMIAGPLGGFLFVVAACVPFFVNARTYAASAVLVGLVAVAEVWSELLRSPDIGIDDDFFALGGDSILGAQVAARLRERFDIALPLRTLFEASTVARLAARIERAVLADIQTELAAGRTEENSWT